jgi:hypothetical protein
MIYACISSLGFLFNQSPAVVGQIPGAHIALATLLHRELFLMKAFPCPTSLLGKI